MEGLLAGKKAAVVSVTNRFSLGWGIAEALKSAGASVLVAYQGERTQRNVSRLVAEEDGMLTVGLDVQYEDQISQWASVIDHELGGIDILVHSLAYAAPECLSQPFIETSRENYAEALMVSAYSLLSLTRVVRPFMAWRGGGSIITLTYLGSERVVPNYNVMGVAKAALEANVRYLAYDLGPDKIRVNAISAGPRSTAASRGIKGFLDMAHEVEEVSPLGRGVELSEIGGTAVFLASDLSTATTGETLYVDCGYNVMGVSAKRPPKGQ